MYLKVTNKRLDNSEELMPISYITDLLPNRLKAQFTYIEYSGVIENIFKSISVKGTRVLRDKALIASEFLDKLALLKDVKLNSVTVDRYLSAVLFVTYIQLGFSPINAFLATNKQAREAYKADNNRLVELQEIAKQYSKSSLIVNITKNCVIDYSAKYAQEREQVLNTLLGLATNNPLQANRDDNKPISTRSQIDAGKAFLEATKPIEEKGNININIGNNSENSLIKALNDTLTEVSDTQLEALDRGNTTLEVLGKKRVTLDEPVEESY